MLRHRGFIGCIATLGLLLSQSPAFATNGYFSHGFGTESKGMAGAGAALPDDLMGPATNPATIVFVTPGIDFGLAVFSPDRTYGVTGAPSGYPGTFGLAPGEVRSGSRVFPIPHFGMVRPFDGGRSAWALTMFGNGGMNTSYSASTFGATPTGVNLTQMFVGATYARRLGANQSFGITPLVAYQRFSADGLGAFAPMSSNPAALTNASADSSYGGGVRVGYLAKLSHQVSLGASYQSHVWMTKFDKYRGLFAGNGSFDIPSNWTAGIAIKPTRALDLAADVQQIRYSEVAAIGNGLLPNLMSAPLGTANGAGFGWHDMTILKLGAQLRRGQGWTWRAGYSYGQQPVQSADVLFNILAPGVVEHHATFGVSRDLTPTRTLHLSVMRAFTKEVTGPNPLDVPNAERIRLQMNEVEVEVGMTFHF